MRLRYRLLALVLAASTCAAGEDAFVRDVRPLLARYCIECHDGAKKAKGDVDFAAIATGADAMVAIDLWRRTAKQIDGHEMPPPKAKQPSDAERAALLAAVRAYAEPKVTWEQVRPVLATYCHRCHGGAAEESADGKGGVQRKGGIDLAAIATADAAAKATFWRKVGDALREGKMPPAKEPAPAPEERARLRAWVAVQVRRQDGEIDCTRFGEADPGQHDAALRTVWSRRMTRLEYRNTVRDLLGVELDVERLLPADGGSGDGFDTNGSTLFVSAIHLERYLAAAELAIAQALADPAARRRLLVAEPGAGLAAPAALRRVVAAFARRAFRRPATDAEVERLLAPGARALARGDAFADAAALAIAGALISPRFLLLVQPEPASSGLHDLDQHGLATRLSYFLWSSMPDDALAAAADAGRLGDPAELRRQTKRMLADPRSRALGEGFGRQWLGATLLGAKAVPDPQRFPAFTPELQRSMEAEVIEFVAHLLREDRDLGEIVDADYAFLDERLARHYGVAGVVGDAMRRVPLPDRRRGGVLGMAAPLTATSASDRTSPILRGKWVLEDLLGEHVPPPPPNAGELPDERGADGAALTVRQRLELHRTRPDCMACHQRIDPLGFALESYDGIGRWRDSEDGRPLDTAGALPDGRVLAGVEGLKAHLSGRRDQVLRQLARKLLVYALGRELTRYDRCVVDEAMQRLAANGRRSHALIEAIVESDAFRRRIQPPQKKK